MTSTAPHPYSVGTVVRRVNELAERRGINIFAYGRASYVRFRCRSGTVSMRAIDAKDYVDALEAGDRRPFDVWRRDRTR